MPERARPVRLALIASLVGLAALMVWFHAATTGATFLDTFNILDGVAVASRCLDAHVTSNCGPEVGRFALLQYLPAFVFHALGMSYGAGLRGLVALNGLAVAGVAGVGAYVVRRLAGSTAAALAAVVVLASPLLWYSNSGYGEALAALVTMLFTAGVLLGWPLPAVAVAMLLAGISKETAPPFLLVLALIAWRLRRDERPATRRELVTLMAAAGGAVLINGGFNVFRYGTFTNPDYTHPDLGVPLLRVLEGFAGQLVSPTYGLIWVWPAAIAVLALAIAKRRSALVRDPAVAVVAVLIALTGSFALHYAPYGGTTVWGPRFLMPWIPALLALCVATDPGRFARLAAAAVGTGRAFAVTAALVLVTGLPNLIVMVDSSRWPRPYPGAYFDRRELIIRPVVPDRPCPKVPDLVAGISASYYYRCLHHATWQRGLRAAAAYEQLPRPREVISALAWVLAIVALLGFSRAELAARPRVDVVQ
jgi:hypothetical protein